MPVTLSRPAGPDSGPALYGTSPRAVGLGRSHPVAGRFRTRYREPPRAACPIAVVSKCVRSKPQVQEAAGMTSGFVLLILIGILVAFAYTRLRGKMKLSISGRNWVWPIVIVVVIALMLWASSHNGSHTGH